MSEVIVRMEKFPTKCFDCKMWSICEALNKAMAEDQDWSASDLFYKTENGFTKPVDCPIIGVLPEQHGRLIDEAVFCENVVKYSHQSTKTIGKALDATPTIIEMTLIDTERSET